MNEDPVFEAENKTPCPQSTDDTHDWEWDREQDDYFCTLCEVWHEQQEGSW